jgi:DNA-binding NtrC family response regulator/class 3 adenylate cyclase/predicted ATPase
MLGDAVLPELVGDAPALLAIRKEVTRLLQRRPGGGQIPPILILGETGTGKGLLAAAIHRSGPRRDGPFVAVNCAAIPDTLLEAELFGFERGAFTDARHTKAGLVQTAHRGTLFLDEIALLPEALQGKLLTAIEERAVRRLGQTRAEPVDIAIIAAASDNLEVSAREGRFSAALYHRLSVLTLSLPPLRDRGEDILLLAEHFLARAAADYDVRQKRLTPEAQAALLVHPWPGNVRELSNRMQHVTLLAEADLVTREMLGLHDAAPPAEAPGAAPTMPQLRDRVGTVERQTLLEALDATGGNITHAATRLGIPPTTLRYRLRKHGLIAEPPRDPDPARGDRTATASRVRPSPAAVSDAPAGVQDVNQAAPLPGADADQAAAPGALLPSGAERRQLTVLSCALSAVPDDLDPEDLHEVLRLAHETCAAVIRRFDGYVGHRSGDGLLVYFGFPQAREDGPHRAIRAGMAILDEVSRVDGRGEGRSTPGLVVRLGIHTGLVVIGPPESGEPRDRLIVGDTPRIASALCELAEWGTLLISGATHAVTEGYFDCEAVNPRKPGDPPVAAHRVVRESTARTHLDVATARGLTPFVGREQELALLLTRWEQAKEGHGQVVMLGGEAGIGKSRLIQVVKERLGRESGAAIECRCAPHGQHTALHPIAEYLRQLACLVPGAPPEENLARLESALASRGLGLEDTVPFLAPLLSLRLSDRYRRPLETPERLKQHTLDALVAWMLLEAERRPSCLVLEDLHWVDPSTVELLDRLVEQVPTARMLVLLTFRPEFTPPWPARSHTTHIVLGRLGRRHAEDMAVAVARGTALPDGILRQVADRADGIPLFVEELTKATLEAVATAERGETSPEPLRRLAVPATLHDSLMARLDRLGTGKHIAQIAAVLGREFAYPLIHAISPVDDETLGKELSRLVDAELLYRRGPADQARYVFKHVLIQEAAYHSLLTRTRQRYHAQIAEVLEQRFPDIRDIHPEVIAHHYTEAGRSAEAIRYWHRAGARAVETSANVEAIGHLGKALRFLDAQPDTPARREQELTLRLALGAPLLMIKGQTAAEVEQTYARAHGLAQEQGDEHQRFAALVGLWRFHLNSAKLGVAHDLGQQCLAVAEQVQDARLLQEAHQMLGSVFLYQGELVSARRHLEQGADLDTLPQNRAAVFRRGTEPGIVCRCRLAWTLWMLGYPDQAVARIEEALARARDLSHAPSLAFAFHYAAVLHQSRREPHLAQRWAEATIALANEHRFVYWLAAGMCVRGWALAEQGALDEGIAELRQGLASWRSIRIELATLHMLARMAEAHRNAGHVDEALSVLDEGAGPAHRGNEERHYAAELHRLRGELLLQQTVPDERRAEACFQRAFEIAEQQRGRSLQLRAALSLGRLWQRDARSVDARRLVTAVYGWFTEGQDTPDLQEARAFLAGTTVSR